MVGPVVVLNPSGSSLPKYWPYSQQLMDALAEKQVHCVVLGDLRGKTLVPPKDFGHVIGRDWSIREAMAFSQLADVVVGTESAIVNSVALEDNLKVVLLSHSTPNNLTKHWKHTVPVKPAGLSCYPCHRVHMISYWCTKDQATQTSACQAAASAEAVSNIITRYLETRGG
jgi:ADP-heptose:LPS heptosyltransferase